MLMITIYNNEKEIFRVAQENQIHPERRKNLPSFSFSDCITSSPPSSHAQVSVIFQYFFYY